ncbi:hypothetical protein G3N95_12170 [Paraburkholderia sp. Tr-20389]|uniref:hypothetical protein n=1 Tax=Paraburkholderia sp. Tr-20389 TaxID=2703903 RepID=UPI00197E2F37|nr:hypothetical protein [Paraburkholderia sp. Tr-20389]MBN3753698.1 hypothetical protein [Paraburkholderia sp. Tr-20389]
MTNDQDPEGCADTLKALLSTAQDAAQNGDADKRSAASLSLRDFISSSSPNNEFIQGLDEIAGQAAIALLRQNIDQCLQDIAACNVALAKASKQFDAAAMQANDTAKKLSLTELSQALSALNQSVQSIQQLRRDFGSGADKDLLSSLDTAEKAIDTLGTVLSRRKA